jgi:hypothetical protein
MHALIVVRLKFGYNLGGFIDINSGKKTDTSRSLLWKVTSFGKKGIVSVFLPSVQGRTQCIRKTNQYDGKRPQVEPDKQECYWKLSFTRDAELQQEMTMTIKNPTDPSASITVPIKQSVSAKLETVEDIK